MNLVQATSRLQPLFELLKMVILVGAPVKDVEAIVPMFVRNPFYLYLLYGAGILLPAVPLATVQSPNIQNGVLLGFGISLLGFLLTVWLVPKVKLYTLRKGLFGKDINKRGTEAGEILIPESLGLACGVVFLICLVMEELLHFYDFTSIMDPVSLKNLEQDGQGIDAWLVDYNAALAAICFMLFLGFVDDVLDLPWKSWSKALLFG
eukprot:TRINITY_DN33823_c0_g2_i1.p2 TRINITY_DN33823_c0_g2~~TRINITY_DN33823_c0_g2_i1.p2  ORF type:complete len:206 (+),score=20.76 TRINITY_DN33823_c0_g2_i1:7-624(+)